MKRPTAVIVTCIDYRFQHLINTWIGEHYSKGDFDRVALAGGVWNRLLALEQIDLSIAINGSSEVVLINHEDCGAYKSNNTLNRLESDLHETAKEISSIYPDLTCRIFMASLTDGIRELDR